MASDIVSNPKAFWNFVNSKRKGDDFPNFMKYKDFSSSNPNDICEFFRDFFSSSYNSSVFEADEKAFDHLGIFPKTTFTTVLINEDIVKKYLDKLTNNTSPGPDGIPEIILKNCSKTLANPLGIIFNLSINSGTFPSIWKDSYTRPIHKKGHKNDVCNYRPIAKLSAIPKIFELIIFDSIYPHCKTFLTVNQHGFVKNKSTVTNLIESTSIFIKNMEDGCQTDTIYTDLSKAFDLLPHSIILLKLRMLGFPCLFLKWVQSYLLDRSYTVIFRSAKSSPFKANSGVPQGSHLGPLLFIISINDVVSKILNSNVHIYADDMKIFRKINTLDDCNLLQDDLNRSYEWCKINNLCLNINKCAIVTYTRRLNPVQYKYSFDSKFLSKLNSRKDLHRCLF